MQSQDGFAYNLFNQDYLMHLNIIYVCLQEDYTLIDLIYYPRAANDKEAGWFPTQSGFETHVRYIIRS